MAVDGLSTDRFICSRPADREPTSSVFRQQIPTYSPKCRSTWHLDQVSCSSVWSDKVLQSWPGEGQKCFQKQLQRKYMVIYIYFFSTLLFCGLIGGCGASIGVFGSHSVLGKSTYYFSERILSITSRNAKNTIVQRNNEKKSTICLNPFTPSCDQDRISPYNIHTISTT